MATKTATEELELLDLGTDDHGPGEGGFGPGDGEGHRAGPLRPSYVYVTGIWLALAAILMFFLALTSAFIVRKGLSNDWVPVAWPGILWFNTLVLLASSLTLERARSLLTGANLGGFRRWWATTTGLGLIFLLGQVIAWRQLAAAGFYVSTNPSSSFFYLLTAAHGTHLLGGIVALLYVGARHRLTAVKVSSLYWHFMGGLWVFLFLLLQLGQ
ncbi:MAG: heme-copper oxidase subunit III [Terriglobia bacterium]